MKADEKSNTIDWELLMKDLTIGEMIPVIGKDVTLVKVPPSRVCQARPGAERAPSG
ncbi:MAG: hypothetical protein KAW12_14610 [Candidatus Aminicenantes bacterium]|nr:hypothetical protein [Candidatus Aminicenantes bacterium]